MKLLHALMLALPLGLAACVPPPQPAPLPYRFSIGKFEDKRTPEQLGDITPYQFSQPAFLVELRKAMPYTLFGSEDASLNLGLTHFEATTFDDSYALSMVMEVEGSDQYHRTMASQPLMCSAVENRGFELDEYAQQVWKDKNLQALTPAAREQKVWDKLFSACVRHLANQFGQVLVQQQTATERTR